MTGMLASSKAGHDKNKIYVIIREEGEYVWVADGVYKCLTNPKKKRKKHIQIIKYYSDKKLVDSLKKGNAITDLEIRMVIKDYQKQQ